MKHVVLPGGSSVFLNMLLDVREREGSAFLETEYEPLDEERAQTIVGILESVRLLGGEERVLLQDVSSKVNHLLDRFEIFAKQLGVTEKGYARTKVVPLETLTEKLAIRRPILAVIEHSEGSVTATYYECEVFGVGETEFEALDDLRQSLAEYYCQLKESPETLGPLPLRHLRILTQLILEV